MAVVDDTEAQAVESNVHDEQTPLLAGQQPESALDGPPEYEETGEQHLPEKKRKASWYIWRGLWVIVGVLFLAAFIKGWIDAGGDVDVCT
jgi:hypothetical protein